MPLGLRNLDFSDRALVLAVKLTMRATPAMLLWLSVTASAFAAGGPQASHVQPQPRLRLVQNSAIAAHQGDSIATSAPPSAVVMDKFVVRDAPLPGVPQPVQPEPGNFSLLEGGGFFTTKLGSLPLELGIWTPVQLMTETAKFRAQKTNAEFDLLRLKF